MTTRAALHELVDRLPDDLLDRAAHTLATIQDDPVMRTLENASLDDEPYTDEERREDDRIIERFRREGGGMTSEEVLRLIRNVRAVGSRPSLCDTAPTLRRGVHHGIRL